MIITSPPVCVCACVRACVRVSVFYFSATRRDIDLKLMQDTYSVVLDSLRKIDLHRSKIKVTGTVHCFFEGTVISQKLGHRKMSYFFIDTS